MTSISTVAANVNPSLAAVYLASDLCDDATGEVEVWFYPQGTPYRYPHYDRSPEWEVRYVGRGSSSTYAFEPTLPTLRAWVAWQQRPRPAFAVSSGRAERSAAVFFARVRLTADDLLADPEFRRLAREAAERGKSFSRDLLAWEKKDRVAEAVARVRAVVDAERAAAAEVAARQAAERAAREAAERPTREAVLAAYAECGYRVCTQGHATFVEIGERVGVSADVFKGDAYSSRCTFRRQDSRHTLRVRTGWLEAVAARGLETFGGRLVLDAEAVGYDAATGDEVLSLRVAAQGRGTGLETETVRVVRRGDEWQAAPKSLRVADLAERLAAEAGMAADAPAFAVADRLAEIGHPLAAVAAARV